jgi:hypothetical protein
MMAKRSKVMQLKRLEVMRRVTHFINSTDAAISLEAALAQF